MNNNKSIDHPYINKVCEKCKHFRFEDDDMCCHENGYDGQLVKDFCYEVDSCYIYEPSI